MADVHIFVWEDYLVLGISLLLSLFVAIFFAYIEHEKTRKNPDNRQAQEDYNLGGRRQPVIIVALSLSTSFLSGVTMLGTPAEIYRRGILFLFYYLSGAIAIVVTGVFFVPIFYSMRKVSVYSYFGTRLGSKLLTKLSALIFLTHTLLYMGVVLYSPANAIAVVTDTEPWPLFAAIGVFCTIYTAIGGFKAVLWTDSIQAIIMYIGMGVLILKGVYIAGGLSQVWRIAEETGRLETVTFWSPNPLEHNNMWLSMFGGFSIMISLYGLNQMAVQRFCSLQSIEDTKWVIFITVPYYVVLGSVACFLGLVMLAVFHKDCGIDSGSMDRDSHCNDDALVTYFAVRTLGDLPGLPGLFLACLFSATLSTVSSGLNSMAAVVWEDFLKDKLSDDGNKSSTLWLKFLVLASGACATAVAFAVGPVGGIMTIRSIYRAIYGPLIGLLLLCIFLPRASKRACMIGLFVGSVTICALAIAFIHNRPFSGYDLGKTCSEIKCESPSDHLNTTVTRFGNQNLAWPFRISFYLYPVMGTLIVIVIGGVLSYIPYFSDEDELRDDERDQRLALTFWGHYYKRVKAQPAQAPPDNHINNGAQAVPCANAIEMHVLQRNSTNLDDYPESKAL